MKCNKCGSKEIQQTSRMKRTGPPNPKPPKDRFRKVSYGYFYTECICECGEKWEVRK